MKTGATTLATSNNVTDVVVEPNISNLNKQIVDIPAGTQDSTYTRQLHRHSAEFVYQQAAARQAYDTQFRDSMPGGTAMRRMC